LMENGLLDSFSLKKKEN
jgi:hypothetical protein